MKLGDYYKREEPLFAVGLAMKDARHAQTLANKAGVRMKNVEIANEYLKVVKEHMGARGDTAGNYGAKRVEAGMIFGYRRIP
jgi:3-hydroxyisobutyrate dehydrogenase-like beta-hydroxyacid dehydrogenase